MATSSPKSLPIAATSPRPRSDASSAAEDAHEQIQADVQTLLTEMTTSFKSFSETIFSKIDVMQDKLAALDRSVADLASTPAPIESSYEQPTNDKDVIPTVSMDES